MSSKAKVPTATLPIYLLKDQYTRATEVLRKSGLHVDEIPGIGVLYTESGAPRHPQWMAFFRDVATPDPKLLNTSTSAVLFVKRASRLFAITFGHGKHLMVQDCWDEGFGLRVTLNSIDPRKIKSIDHKTFETVTRHSRTQTSREGGMEDFGLDVQRDLVRAVTGEPKDLKLGRRLTGMDALVAVVNVRVHDLPGLLELYLAQYGSKSYKADFSWIDNISEVRSNADKAHLDRKLASRLQQGDLSRVWLSVPDIVDWARIGGFKYRPSDTNVEHDLDVAAFLRTVKKGTTITSDFLRGRRIFAMNASGDQVEESWQAYGCLYCEEDDDGQTYLLSTGKWYRIEKSFVEEVNQAIAALVSTRSPLPPYQSTDADEAAYNKRVAATSGGALALMDQVWIHHGGGKSKFEMCDLYSDAKEMIAVKRYGGSSAPLSHLCQQALVVAEMWKEDAEFRKKVNQKLPRSHKLADSTKPPNVKEYPIVLAIVSPSSRAIDKSLPFFARLALRNTERHLRLVGYPMSILKIDKV